MHHCDRGDVSLRGDAGFPDLVLARKDRVMFVEVKSARGRLGKNQAAWFGVLTAAGADARVVYPDQVDALIDELTVRAR